MRWPFKSKKETDIRIFRDPVTGKPTLRLVGPMCLPNSENPIVTLSVQMDVRLDAEAVQRLYEQPNHFAGPEVAAAKQE